MSWIEFLISLNVEYGFQNISYKNGNILTVFIRYNLERYEEAIRSYDKDLVINPDYDEGDEHKDVDIEKL